MRFGKCASLNPVRGDAGAPKLAGAGGVQKKSSGGAVARKADGRASLLDAQSFDYGNFLGNFRNGLRSFFAVELRSGEPQGSRKGNDGLRRPVDEDTHRRYERRQFAEDVARGEWRDG